MARITPEWLSLLQGKRIQYAGADVTQRPKLNFTGDVSVTDDSLFDRTNVDLDLGFTLDDCIDVLIPIIVSQTLGSDITNPGVPASGVRLYSSGGYAHINDSHSGTVTFVGVPRMDLSNANQTLHVGLANDFWLYSGTLTGNRAYKLTSSNASLGSAVTFELLDPGPYTVELVNSCSLSSSLFVRPVSTPVVVDCVYDGLDFNLVGWKYRTS